MVDEVRGGASVLRDEDWSVRLADTPNVHREVVAAFRERDDVLGRTATANRQISDFRHGVTPLSLTDNIVQNFVVSVNGWRSWTLRLFRNRLLLIFADEFLWLGKYDTMLALKELICERNMT